MNAIEDPSRRRFIKLGLACAACLAARPAMAFPFSGTRMKEIAVHNLHTDDQLRVTFWKDGSFVPSALDKINYVLRDYRTGDVHLIEPKLVELLHDLQYQLRTDKPFQLISGYRSPKTNAMLSEHSDGVAKKSLHMQGQAADIRLEGISLRRIQTTALLMQRGGVGFYPQSDFVHVDIGRVRHWGQG